LDVCVAIGAVLLVGMIACVMTAGNASGGKQWLAVMDRDHDGSVSKQEFTAYMEAQFDKAGADHDGTLDRNELEQLRKNLAIATKQ
jgi:Ca2+-binding EF-hand superfamily protein